MDVGLQAYIAKNLVKEQKLVPSLHQWLHHINVKVYLLVCVLCLLHLFEYRIVGQ